MGSCLLVFPIRLNPIRRWRSLYQGRKSFVSLPVQPDYISWLLEDFNHDDYDDKHMINCDSINNNDKNACDTSNIIYDNKQDFIEIDHDNYDDYNGDYHTNHSDYAKYDHYDSNYNDGDNLAANYGADDDAEEGEEEDDDDDEVGLIKSYHAQHKKKGVVIMRRAKGLEGFWQRQAYLHTYKFTRRKTLCERAIVPMRKLRMAWGVVRGLYAKQARRVHGKLKAISNSANFHHTSFLLLSKQYFHPYSSTLSFMCSSHANFIDQHFNLRR